MLVLVAVSAIRPPGHSQQAWRVPIVMQGASNLPQGKRHVQHVLRARIAQSQERIQR